MCTPGAAKPIGFHASVTTLKRFACTSEPAPAARVGLYAAAADELPVVIFATIAKARARHVARNTGADDLGRPTCAVWETRVRLATAPRIAKTPPCPQVPGSRWLLMSPQVTAAAESVS